MPLLSVDNSVTDSVDENVGNSAKDIYERASTDDKMIVLFSILIGNIEIQRNMTNTYRELNLKVPQNVRIGPPQKSWCVVLNHTLLNVSINI